MNKENLPNPPTPVALVTGGARRIGAAICETLHRAGFNVIIHYRRSATLAEQLAHQLNQARPNSAQVRQADLNNTADIECLAQSAVAAWGHINVLVNNASSFYPTPIGSARECDWDDLIGSNVKAPFFLSQALAANLKLQHGCIINISDIFGERPMPNHSVYSIAKAGNRMLTQSLALELAPEIRVNGIAPGAILWPEDDAGEELPDPDKLLQIPLGQLGGTDAVAGLALFLINDAPYITGQIVSADGGRTLRQ